MRRSFAVAVVLLLFAGCQEDIAGPVSVSCAALLTSYAALTGDTVTTSEGVRYFDVEPGVGQAAAVGGTLDVNYSLYSLAGAPLDSNCDAGVPVLRFLLGGQSIIPGFQIGVIGMRQGGVRRVIVPPELGYGDQVLVFDIQLIELL